MSRIRVKRATIVSMDPALGIIESGDLLIDRDKIIAVGRDIGSWAVREIDGRGMIASAELLRIGRSTNISAY